jgi:hypothetical protein
MKKIPINRKFVEFTLERKNAKFSQKKLSKKRQNLSEVLTGKGVQSLRTQLVFRVMQLSTRKPSAL